MMKFDAVLFDWMLTLAHYPPEEEHVVSALRKLGRDADSVSIGGIVADIFEARNHPDAKAAFLVEDTSREAHSHSEFLVYEKAGLDTELASAMYELLGTPDFHAPYPDSKSTLKRVKDAVDGAAATLGVTCLILPQVIDSTPDQERGLSVVSDLLGLR